MQKPRLTIFRVAVMADLAARRQNTISNLPLLVSSLQPFQRHRFSQSTPRLANSSSNRL
ncbi:hypothetical protein K443DRAFT_650383 [Laccaria amethystina LaAM-08-1]|uniref:Uncharacterized protein n=1 Tax=Laccaria amethystina LaAM-08-1 TaxID=1095629 RepID=A0A0C9X389_9AGAR|nr:hypothetical protein K443DRAFT_650383 [Laccaria amethystina LaAM-08-1]